MLDVILHAVTTLSIMDPYSDEPHLVVLDRPFTLFTMDTSVHACHTAMCAVTVAQTSATPYGLPYYISRFGDQCCANCHVTLAWSPEWVRDGLYGDDTDAWTAATVECFVQRFIERNTSALQDA